eukprot:CAMPEP_0171962988 /NCGR_PEP_ID=MMETSP0993-20121228/172792_1 /TAXON_ID=483369 /ORGANISM="non described non described, Strain CCMP2098" /LENGTH=82 /DNA_ID=CAMNT_0012611457 /DNA_START=67 /DNA_END=313 /DNA_ORIENTATION=-
MGGGDGGSVPADCSSNWDVGWMRREEDCDDEFGDEWAFRPKSIEPRPSARVIAAGTEERQQLGLERKIAMHQTMKFTTAGDP